MRQAHRAAAPKGSMAPGVVSPVAPVGVNARTAVPEGRSSQGGAQFDVGSFVHSPDSHDRVRRNPQKNRNVRFGPLVTNLTLGALV